MTMVLMFLLAYLIGCLPSGLIIGKVFYNKDIRQSGSGNLGTTNTFRVLGKKAGIIVMILDIFKGFIVVFLPLLFNHEVHGVIIGLFAILGHVYPVFLKFRGGKAVATSAGVIMGVNPILFVAVTITFIIVLYLFKFVSLASIIASIVNFILSIVFMDWILIVIAFVIMLIVIIRHRSNIKRIINKEEPKITWM
ncbi:glycerol-3-phosphate 1-O-acyltransferase PlsY [Macrococcus equipercicus]|uniref:Glycerol-3-phosphate acyltransferase n=1 Tax=Macrococcus equipercicus TaxID=69967 RepID=A0ABQ6RAL8_9STAP|nr:glycerol-3-phosphate 1-O-acyltransferase PlsY [Macrococcus equipercicus]KAA1040288.1 glycerol-3-phosphate 1-O-acyltransferase PlsY [Macrococcus equipercicus]